MVTNRKCCTIWGHTVVDRTPTYLRHETGKVYWEDVKGQSSMANDARSPADSVFLSIPEDSLNGYMPKPDDRIMEGSINKEKPPLNALTVTSVRDCLHGSKAVRHIEVRAE